MREKIKQAVGQLSSLDQQALQIIHETWQWGMTPRWADNEELAHTLVVLEKILVSCRG